MSDFRALIVETAASMSTPVLERVLADATSLRAFAQERGDAAGVYFFDTAIVLMKAELVRRQGK
jgi:hypothetical protein